MLWNKGDKNKRQDRPPPTKLIQVQPQMTKKRGKKIELGIDPQDMYRPPPISQSINDPYNLYSSLHESKSNNEEREGEKKRHKVEILLLLEKKQRKGF